MDVLGSRLIGTNRDTHMPVQLCQKLNSVSTYSWLLYPNGALGIYFRSARCVVQVSVMSYL
jgi:hypothetical protein